MFFNKPDGIRYVDMCKYIDDNAYSDNCDEGLVYEYIYHISIMIASKCNYFNTSKELDEFGLYAASYYYSRIVDDRQFKDGGGIKPIRSILNYIRATLFSVKDEYSRKFSPLTLCGNIISTDDDEFRAYAERHSSSTSDSIDFICSMENIHRAIMGVVSDTPYSEDPIMSKNIYISCMLSFLSQITVRNKEIDRIRFLKTPVDDRMMDRIYCAERYSKPILYHLPDNMCGYISVLTNKSRRRISSCLSESVHDNVYDVSNIKSLMYCGVV